MCGIYELTYLYVFTHVCPGTHMWQSEDPIRCLPRSVTTVIFETVSLTRPVAQQFGNTRWPANPKQQSSCLCFPVLGVFLCASFYAWHFVEMLEIRTQILMLMWQVLYQQRYLPTPSNFSSDG